MDVGARIRYFRKKQGLSQEKLAWEADLNTAFLGEVERGKKSPTVKTLERIASALHINLYELFAGPESLSEDEERALSRIVSQLRILPPEKLRKMALIIQTILDMQK